MLMALVLILAWASVPLGSNRAWSMALLSALLLGLAFIVLMAGLCEFALSAIAIVMPLRLSLVAAQVLMSVALLWSGSRGAVLAVTIAITVTFLSLLPVR
jgi:hypothetical protein